MDCLENDLKIWHDDTHIMMQGTTKNSPEKLEYWRNYRRENSERCRNQRRQWREANRDRIRLCARRSYYRRLLRDSRGNPTHVQAVIAEIDSKIATILAMEA